jgi:hypothetical protein
MNVNTVFHTLYNCYVVKLGMFRLESLPASQTSPVQTRILCQSMALNNNFINIKKDII